MLCKYHSNQPIGTQTERLEPQKTHVLESGASETLQAVPVPKRFRVVAAMKGTWTDVAGSAINLHLEGNWMPLRVSQPPPSAVWPAVGQILQCDLT